MKEPLLFVRYRAWRDRRRALQDARHLVVEARRLLRKHGYRIPSEDARQVSEHADAIAAAIRERDVERVRAGLSKLEEAVDKHLGFARKSTFREYAESIGVAVLVALFLRSFVVEAFKIPSGSMIPTLQIGDHIFVNKFIYGLGWPLSGVKFWQYGKPSRGEIVVFKYPNDIDKDFIKRVIGVEGDTVEMRDNLVYVNGKPVERTHRGRVEYDDCNEESTTPTTGCPRKTAEEWEEVLDGHHFTTYYETGHMPQQYHPHQVPAGMLFVMGDNRDNSSDSRVWGFVPAEYVKGRALIVWWSHNEMEGTRWERFLPPMQVK